MAYYLLRRMVASFITVALITFFCFIFVALLPGNPAIILLGDFATPDNISVLTRQWGLDKPLFERYQIWLTNLFRGNFGVSIFSQQPTLGLIAHSWPVTIELTFLAITMACLVGIPWGLYASTCGPYGQRFLMGTILIAQSIPSYVTAMVLILIICIKLRLLPASGYIPFLENPLQNIRAMVLPSVSLGLVISAFLARFTRSCMLDALGEDFVRTARSKGLGEGPVIIRHAFRAALIPVISLLGTQIVWFFGGAIIQEVVFVLPGLGQLVVRAVLNRDYAVLQVVILLLAIVAAACNLLVDLAYGVMDPRIRYD